MTLKTYIIDDEAPARREIRYLLEQLNQVEIVGEAANGSSAFKGIRDTRPDLIFLDIQMPGMSGLELAQFLCELPEKPLLVFATACGEHALQAFEVEALDYLCKPFTKERLEKAVTKALRAIAASSQQDTAIKTAEPCRKIPLYKGESIIPTSPEQIIFACSEDGDNMVHTIDGGRFRTRCTLNELENKLGPNGFIRPHRSFLININHVREVVPWFNGSYKLFMDNKEQTEIPVSRYNAKELKRYFNL